MKSILIADTTREERELIVAESIGNIDGPCDGCSPGLIKMYQDHKTRGCCFICNSPISFCESDHENGVEMGGKPAVPVHCRMMTAAPIRNTYRANQPKETLLMIFSMVRAVR